MTPRDVAATTHPAGYRIDVSWALPAEGPAPRVRVVRRVRTHPVTANPRADHPGEGVVVPAVRMPVAGQPGRVVVTDDGLRGGAVYYYALFPYAPGDHDPMDGDDSAPVTPTGPPVLTSALAIGRAGLGEEMYALLPAIHRRFDEPTLDAVAAGSGQLHRFLQLPGGALDVLHARALALLGALDVERVDGDLLPLLAQWIGWPTDRERSVGERRNDLRRAPALYRTTGLAPAIESGVRGVIHRSSRIKEFVHNVATTNRPPRWNLWQCRPGAEPELLSTDASSAGGRVTAVSPDQERTWLVYACDRDGRSGLRVKQHPAGPGEPASAGWSASRVIPTPGRATRPNALFHGGRILLWWDSYDDARETSSLACAELAADATPTPVPELVPPGGGDAPRRAPLAASAAGGLWVFWQEWRDDRWQLFYDRHDGTRWSGTPRSPLPTDWTASVGDDTWLLPDPGRNRLWLFVPSRERVAGPAGDPTPRFRWRISVHAKRTLNPAVTDWEPMGIVPPGAGGEDDREPSARTVGPAGLDVLWSSRRAGRWSVWHSELSAGAAFGPVTELTAALSGLRAPVAPLAGSATVVVRSSASVPIRSAAYGTQLTVDGRFPGSTTAHAGDRVAHAACGTFDDIGTYTYDTRRSDAGRYARDTIGLFVPDDLDDARIQALRRRVPEFLPATDRAVVLRERGGPD